MPTKKIVLEYDCPPSTTPAALMIAKIASVRTYQSGDLEFLGLAPPLTDVTSTVIGGYKRVLRFLVTGSVFEQRFPTDDLQKAAMRHIYEGPLDAGLPGFFVAQEPVFENS